MKKALIFILALISTIIYAQIPLTLSDGSTYTGEMKDGKLNGKGTLIWKTGDKYEGDWVNSMMNGYGVYTSKNGTIYKGEWKDHKKNGKGTQYYNDGRVYEGSWINNKRDGYGVIKNKLGEVIYKGEFKNDLWHGKGTQYLSGTVYEGDWKDGIKHGQGVFTDKDGKKKSGEWNDNKYVYTEKHHEDAKVYVILGQEQLNSGNFIHAEFFFDQAVETLPETPSVYYYRGIAKLKSKKYDEAIKDFQNASLLDPENHLYYNAEADTYAEMKDFRNALSAFTVAIMKNPNIAEYYYKRAIMKKYIYKTNYHSCKDFKEAAMLGHTQALQDYKKYKCNN